MPHPPVSAFPSSGASPPACQHCSDPITINRSMSAIGSADRGEHDLNTTFGELTSWHLNDFSLLFAGESLILLRRRMLVIGNNFIVFTKGDVPGGLGVRTENERTHYIIGWRTLTLKITLNRLGNQPKTLAMSRQTNKYRGVHTMKLRVHRAGSTPQRILTLTPKELTLE